MLTTTTTTKNKTWRRPVVGGSLEVAPIAVKRRADSAICSSKETQIDGEEPRAVVAMPWC
jgi:hypothetical protein